MSNAAVRRVVRDVAPWIERTARLGLLSIGVVYIIAGLMTAAAASGLGGHTANWTDAIEKVSAMPFGNVALYIVALGLLGYAVWGVSNGVADGDRRGNDAKGLSIRAGSIGSGIVHAAMAVTVVRFAATHVSRGGSDSNARHWTGRAMQMPLIGRLFVASAGAALIAYGAYSIWRAWEAKLSRKLHIENAPGRKLLAAISRFGIAARGVVIVVIGISCLLAARHRDPQQTRSTKGALEWISGVPYGNAVLLAVSIGLVAYGIYSIIKARYRTVRAA